VRPLGGRQAPPAAGGYQAGRRRDHQGALGLVGRARTCRARASTACSAQGAAWPHRRRRRARPRPAGGLCPLERSAGQVVATGVHDHRGLAPTRLERSGTRRLAGRCERLLASRGGGEARGGPRCRRRRRGSAEGHLGRLPQRAPHSRPHQPVPGSSAWADPAGQAPAVTSAQLVQLGPDRLGGARSRRARPIRRRTTSVVSASASRANWRRPRWVSRSTMTRICWPLWSRPRTTRNRTI
jgi:hypothetical protein